jgi:4-hydroxymandelate oxidase
VYAIGPPEPGAPPAPGRLRISAGARRAFTGPPAIAARPDHRPHLHEYLSDLVRPYQLTLRPDGHGHSYGEMAAALIPELVPADRPVGVVVLAFAVPDVRPGRATATYLGELCPGSPLTFAVCDQGAAAGYTGLRLAGEYARAGDCPGALLLVVEQAALPYDAGLPVPLPPAHRAVGLRLDRTGPAAVRTVRQHADVAPGRVAELLAGELTGAAAGGRRELRLIADPDLAAGLAGGPVNAAVRVVPASRGHTGGWWELAEMLAEVLAEVPAEVPAAPERPDAGRVVLASYDRQLRYLCVSVVDIGPDR